jgi:magnesium transporter
MEADQLGIVRNAEGWVWLDLVDPSEGEITAIGDMFGFDPLSVRDVLDVMMLPKVEHHDDCVFVVLHGVVVGEDQRLKTEELDLFIGDGYLVTAHRTSMVAVDWIFDEILSGTSPVTVGPAGIAAAIAEAQSRRYLPLLDTLDDRIEALEDHAMAADPRTLGESQALRRDVILLRRTLGPQRDVLRQLSHSTSRLIEATSRSFEDVYDHYFRLVESLDAARALLGVVLDTYRGAVAERTNEVMRVLTVFSAIMLPLALIAGMWGMNFASIPASEEPWGFLGLLGVMAALGIGLWVYFVRRGFIGGLKLREIPKSVGLGLVHLGATPRRVVSGLLPGSSPSHSQEEVPPDE